MNLNDLIVKRECVVYSPKPEESINVLQSIKRNIISFMGDRGYSTYQNPLIDPPIMSLIFDFKLGDANPPLKYKIRRCLGLLTDHEYRVLKYDISLERTIKRFPLFLEVSFYPFSGKTDGIKVIFVTKPVIFFLIDKKIIPEYTLENDDCDLILSDCNELITNLIGNILGQEIQPKTIVKKVNNYRDLIQRGENESIEFKSSLWWDYNENKKNKELEYQVIKTIAAFLNSKGGYLFIGISDDGEILGLEKDYNSMSKSNRDGFLQSLTNAINNCLGKTGYAEMSCQIEEIEGKEVCVIIVQKSKKPIFLKYKKNQEEFYIRANSSSQKLELKESVEYTHKHFSH